MIISDAETCSRMTLCRVTLNTIGCNGSFNVMVLVILMNRILTNAMLLIGILLSVNLSICTECYSDECNSTESHSPTYVITNNAMYVSHKINKMKEDSTNFC